LLPAADGGRLPASGAVTLPPGTDRGLVRALAPWVAGLVDLAPHQRHLVPLLGVRTLELAEVVDGLSATDPAALRRLLDVVPSDARTLEQLATLPVVLADGRTVRGARGLVVADGVPAAALRTLCRWGVRAVHPDQAHPLLERLGAERLDAWGVLRHDAVRERVLGADPDEPADPADTAWPDLAGDLPDHPPSLAAHGPAGDVPDRPADDAAAVADVVLGLVRVALAGGPAPEVAWWGELLLEADDGDRLPAAGLVLPGSDAARWFDAEVLPPVAEALRTRWPDELAVVGVRSGLRVLTVTADPDVGSTVDVEADADDDPAHALDGWREYLDDLADLTDEAADVAPVEHLVVADLDAVRPEAWPEVLRALAAGGARPALTDPVLLPGGGRAPSYTAWWLRRRSPLGLGRPFLLPGETHDGATWATGLLADSPAALAGHDEAVLRALGGVASLAEFDPHGWADVLDHLPGPGAEVPPAVAGEVWRALVRLATADAPLDPDRLPAWSAGRVVVAATDDVAVADPMWAQHPAVAPAVVVP
ncbi:ATP-binding protein, partial [Actinotalea ferrariae]|nr:ATP-binding protein [Actinotalea ferrariae]